MKVVLDESAYMPRKAHDLDAGYDLFLPKKACALEDDSDLPFPELTIKPGEEAVIDTGVHIALPPGTVGLCLNKSGLSINSGIESVLGVIDSGYTGSIKIKLRNTGKTPHTFYPGQKISQLVVLWLYLADNELELIDELKPTERGNGGFGSTGA